MKKYKSVTVPVDFTGTTDIEDHFLQYIMRAHRMKCRTLTLQSFSRWASSFLGRTAESVCEGCHCVAMAYVMFVLDIYEREMRAK